MIGRYSGKEMSALWQEENQFRVMLRIEIYAAEAMHLLGRVPAADLAGIKSRADFNLERVREIEKTTHHDLLAFLACVGEYVGEPAKYLHMGLTSSDVKDTALAVVLTQAADLITGKLEQLAAVLRRRAKEHKYTVMVGRTHGIHAEPITLGLKFLLWLDETLRGIERMRRAKQTVSVGKLSGAVGTYSNIDPFVEEYVCEKLGLRPDKVATQVIQRDRHAEYVAALAIIGSSLDKFATEIRNLQRTDIREAEEFFHSGQKGSSAMPHKRNPITAERICGLARVLRGNAQAALENVALWHERDISHSSVERIILPDSTLALDYMLDKFTDMADSLLVYPETMLDNLNKTGGLIYSQRIMLALAAKGAPREDAYMWVQRNAAARWLQGADFKAGVKQDPDIAGYLSGQELEECFDAAYMLKHVDTIMSRFGL